MERAARKTHFHFRIERNTPLSGCRDDHGASASPTSQSPTHAALPDDHVQGARVSPGHELDVATRGELRGQRRTELVESSLVETRIEADGVWITHGNPRKIQGQSAERVAQLTLWQSASHAYRNGATLLCALHCYQLGARIRIDDEADGHGAILQRKVKRNAPQTVPAHLRSATVGIEHDHRGASTQRLRRDHQQHAVSADAKVPVT